MSAYDVKPESATGRWVRAGISKCILCGRAAPEIAVAVIPHDFATARRIGILPGESIHVAACSSHQPRKRKTRELIARRLEEKARDAAMVAVGGVN